MTEPECKRCGKTGVHTCSLKELKKSSGGYTSVDRDEAWVANLPNITAISRLHSTISGKKIETKHEREVTMADEVINKLNPSQEAKSKQTPVYKIPVHTICKKCRSFVDEDHTLDHNISCRTGRDGFWQVIEKRYFDEYEEENQRLRSALQVMMERYKYVWGQCEDEPEYKQAKATLDGEGK